ncbi:MAG: type II toxin-antitoxin system RelE/ParE family toxin [Thermodesulfobacteriota bacterium]
MRYRFFPAADRRQDEIWDYTLEKWGERKAVEYMRGMHDAISNAQKDQKLWRTLERTGFEKIFYIRYERHFIFFRVLSGGVLGIISILHERMDIPARLKEDAKGNITSGK